MTGKSQSNIKTAAAMRLDLICVIRYMVTDYPRAGLPAGSIYCTVITPLINELME